MQSFDSTDRHRDDDDLPESPFGGSSDDPGFEAPHAAEAYGSGHPESVPFDEGVPFDAGHGDVEQPPVPMDPYEAAGFDPKQGNRPAEQARVTTPGEAFQDDWTGGEGAGDFLELDASLGAEGGVELEAEAEMELDEAGHALALAEDVPDGTPPGENLFAVEPPAYDEESYEESWDGEDPLAQYEDEDFSLEPETEASSGLLRPGPLVAIGFGLGLVAVVAMTFLDGSGTPTDTEGTVATRGTERGPATRGTEGGPGTADPTATTGGATGPAIATGGTPGPAPRPTPPTTFSGPLTVPPETLMAQFPAMVSAASIFMTPIAPLPEVTEMPSFQPVLPAPPGATSGGPSLALGGPDAGPSTSPPGGVRPTDPTGWQPPDPLDSVPTVAPTLVSIESGEPIDPETLASLSALLRDTTVMYNLDAVPTERVHGPVQIKTPAVGNVRIALVEGDLFEGRLYAVGQGKVWLDTNLGRMGLQAESIESIERLVTASDANGLVKVDPSQVGSRVRARTESGYFISGRVVKVKDEQVTLLTDEGNRITLAAAEVEALGSHPKVRLDL